PRPDTARGQRDGHQGRMDRRAARVLQPDGAELVDSNLCLRRMLPRHGRGEPRDPAALAAGADRPRLLAHAAAAGSGRRAVVCAAGGARRVRPGRRGRSQLRFPVSHMGLDIRIPIGSLFALLGMLLAGYGLCSNPAIYGRSLGLDINLWWGVVLLVFGLAMLGL